MTPRESKIMHSQQDFNPPVGVAQEISAGLRRILAPNASPMTYRGTNTYVIGTSHLAVIDPGPVHPAHFAAIMAATKGAKVEAVLVTHSHVDHSPLARQIADATGAPVLAYGDSYTGRSDVMAGLVAGGMTSGGEGVDPDFMPDQTIADNEVIHGTGWSLTALWTPGHFANHMCFAWDSALFTGDHVMGWASSLVSPPDGDLTQFMASCERLRLRSDKVYYPGHGAPVLDPAARINWLIQHRQSREQQILEALANGPTTVAALTARIYTDAPTALLPAAERNVFAHLIDLIGKQRVSTAEPLNFGSEFYLQ